MAELNSNFIDELLKASITSKNTLEILLNHLEYYHLPSEAYKTVWKEIKTFYELENKLPTVGILVQNIDQYKDVKLDCRHILASIKKLQISNVHDELIQTFEDFKKEVEFVEVYRKTKDIYEENREEAIRFMAKESERISNFSIKEGVFDRVFGDFEKRQRERLQKDNTSNERISSGIHELDYYIRGGFKRGTSFLGLGRSGTGKSTFLRWIAINAARLGFRVILFSLEGLREETLEALDSAWTSTPLQDIEFGLLKPSKVKEIEKVYKGILASGGEIFVHSNEGFDGMTIEQANNTVHEIKKIYGEVDMILFDYLELFEVEGLKTSKDGSGERRRRETLANRITSMSVEHNAVTGAVTQATDIPPNVYNNENFVLTRTNISEFKGVIKPFSYFMTLNQTDDEAEQSILRIFNDKFRKHRSGQTIHIFQKLEIGRFYDSNRTLKFLWDKRLNKKIQS